MTPTTTVAATEPKPGRPVFLSADWRELLMLNYRVDDSCLLPYLPAGTELDRFNGHCYVSLVAFMFHKTKILGAVPAIGHRSFEEINLRFYVVRRDGGVIKRAVVFIKEIVPSAILAWTARAFYNENYVAHPMSHDNRIGSHLHYGWSANSIRARLSPGAHEPATDSFDRWITEHYWGYTKLNGRKSYEYEVRHPVWRLYRVESAEVAISENGFYGEPFDTILRQKPSSAFAAEGSPVTVHWPRTIRV